MPTLTDHPLRYQLANELHARPFPVLSAPAHVALLALKPLERAADRDRAEDRAHLIKLLDRYSAPHPPPGATHYSGPIGRYFLKWESHTEFVTYSVFSEGQEAHPFDAKGFDVYPEEWLAVAPGARVTSALIHIETGIDPQRIKPCLREWFVSESLAASYVLDRSALVAADFRLDAAGHMRMAVFVDPATGPHRIGRIVQRLSEIETYKTMSMLGFARAGELGPELSRLAGGLSEVVGRMNASQAEPDTALTELLSISAEMEKLETDSAFRFGATGAYEAIVSQRIELLREERFEGHQTLAEFMLRRFEPAMRTVQSTQSRLAAISARAMRAGDLLRTQVDVARSAQNQALLESMDRRADLQLRLQQTVEGLSVVAISYYAVNLAGYLAYPLLEPVGLGKGQVMAGLVLPVVLLVWLMVRRIRKGMGH